MPGARGALILLLLINLFNYIDRQVLSAVLPQIEKALLADDAQAGFWAGLLNTAFLLTYMILAPLFGWLGDRMSRWWIIGAAVIFWSLVSGGSGLATTYVILLLTRCLVGVGEAAYGPVAPTLISDFFPVESRGKKLAWFYCAIPVGSALGYALGGQTITHLGDPGWRWAFYFVVPPGILLGLLCFVMKEPARGQADEAPEHHQARLADWVSFLKTPSYILNTAGMTAMTFAMGAFAAWMPTFLQQRRAPGLGSVDPVTLFGAIIVVAGLLATIAGGWAGDRLRSRYSGSYFLVSAITMFIGFPMVILVIRSPFPLNWLFIFITVFCLFFNTGPTNTILANVTHPAVRASAFAFNIFIIHLFGDASSPPIIGLLRDPQTKSLDTGFMVVSVAILVGGIFWLWGARHLEADTRAAPFRLSDVNDGELSRVS
jgi:MFS family permease